METEEEGDEEEEAVEGNGDPEVGLFYRNDTLKNKSTTIKVPVPPLDRYDDNNALEGITIDFDDETEYLDELKGVADNNTAVRVRVVVISKGLRLNFTSKEFGLRIYRIK